ncbi:hypothetical protein Kisp01_64710 [Kineosporia sp. NBRC 101677]|nr:hypothetical protein Kisp01_64710 [Kineosporia sp. NBRC 101677]
MLTASRPVHSHGRPVWPSPTAEPDLVDADRPTERGLIERGLIERGLIERGLIERGPIERGPTELGPD